ncbi:unnamed protein product [Adineta ricciae]|uniref:Centromere protein S n=1 Tax=Adineta ricciae TaxID=249248 RepID=A0A816CHC4_ADIRI|nr:unnamed protein product [Adineta ricciae]
MPLPANDRKPMSSPSSISSQLQAYFNSQQPQQQQQQQHQSSSSIFSNLVNDPAAMYQQQVQRSISSTNSQQSNSTLFDDMQRSFRQSSSATGSGSFFPSNLPVSQQSSNDLMARLTQAMQTRDKQQQHQEKLEEQRRRDMEYERMKIYEQVRLQREEEEERRKIQEANTNRQINFDQLTKSMENKNQSVLDYEQMLARQQYQKEQQAKIEAQQAENVRRYQQYYREQPQQPQQPQQPVYKVTETTSWARHPSQTSDSTQLLSFADIQKQEQEQERRSREAAVFAQQYTKSQILPIPNSSSSPPSTTKPNSWARTLFAGSNNGNSNVPSTSSHITSDHDINENPLAESSSSSSSVALYNQQATNAPKSRSVTNQQPSTPWNGTNSISNPSLQDIQRQQAQNDLRQQQSHHITSGHSSTSTPVWGGNFQHGNASQQSSALSWDNQHSSAPSNKSSNKSSTPWTELKPTSPMATTPGKVNPKNADLTKNEQEAKRLFAATRAQDALSKWTQAQFKDNLKDIDVPTLVQFLKDIDKAGDIMDYVQPYIGSVSKAKEFANDFLIKRNQLAKAEPDLDNERLNELAMAPTSSNDNSGSGGDEGFQVASSNGQKKKAKKMKGQKIDGKQLGFTVNNRPEQRDDIDKRLKAALHAACGKICEQLQTQSNVTVDKQVVAAIGDITFQQIATFCQDLDAFAKHGKRSTINADDVRLLCRRNSSLLEKIDDVQQRPLKPSKATNRSTTGRSHGSSRYVDHNVDITVVESSSDMDDIN